MSDVAILIPVLDRPQRVRQLVENIRAATPQPHTIVFLCDPADRATQDQIALAGGCRMLSPGGSYAHKINAGVAATTEALLFLAADDLRFHERWLDRALARMRGQIQVVGTNDLGNPRVRRGRHSTHSLVARGYALLGTIDEPGVLLHEGYTHNFVDTEFITTARARGVYAHAGDSIVEHLHPHWGKAKDDGTYRLGQASWTHDQQLFRDRSVLWT